ncbi:chloride channel protein [soil metagenome]
MSAKGSSTFFSRIPSQFAWRREYDEYFTLFLALIAGIAMGIVTAGFRYSIAVSHEFFGRATEGKIPGFGPPNHIVHGILVVLIPTVGGLLVGLMIYRVFRTESGHGVPLILKSLSLGDVRLSPRMALRSATSVITITSGGSAGPEGPIIEIGSVLGSLLGRLIGISRSRTGTLIGCGAAAGIAGVFNAPMGGIFLALELILADFAISSFGPIVVAAVAASVTSTFLLPSSSPLTHLPREAFDGFHVDAYSLLSICVLGFFCGGMGTLFIRMLSFVMGKFRAIRGIPAWIKPGLGGLLVGVIGLGFPGVLGEGYAFINDELLQRGAGTLVLTLAFSYLLIACLKMIATAITIGSGGAGGAFAPSMVIGALLGVAMAALVHSIFPDRPISIPVFAFVGMAACLAGVIHVPITSVLIIYEVSGAEYRLLLPTMLAVTCSTLIATQLGRGSAYTMPLLQDGFDLHSERKARASDPLARVRATDVMSRAYTTLAPGDFTPTIMNAFLSSREEAFAVVDEKSLFIGLITAADLRGINHGGDLGSLIIASDIADPHAPTLFAQSPATAAREIFARTNSSAIPVLRAADDRVLIGMITQSSLLIPYYSQESGLFAKQKG